MRAASWPRGVLAGALAGAVAVYAATLFIMDIGARRELDKVKAEAIKMAESLAPAPVPDERNAAPVYERAFEEMGTYSENREKFRWLSRTAGSRDTDVATDEVAGFLREHAEVLGLLHKAASMPGYGLQRRYAPPDANIDTSLLTYARNAANLLALDARRKASDGDMRGALEDVAAGWRMAHHIAATPTLIDCMIAVAVDSTASDPVQDVLASGSVRRADLAGFPLDPKISFVDSHAKAWRMEAAMMLHTVAAPRVWQIEGATHGHNGGLHWRVFIARGLVAVVKETMALAQEVVSQPYWLTRERCDQIDEGLQPYGSRQTLLPFPFLPNVKPSSGAVVATEAQHRLAVLGIAAACFRTEEGRYPNELAELVPGYISAVPIDPFDGKPLRMLAEGDGLVLYSVGLNGVDEGGKDGSWRYGGAGGADISFRLGDAYKSALAKARRPRRKGRRAPKPKSGD